MGAVAVVGAAFGTWSLPNTLRQMLASLRPSRGGEPRSGASDCAAILARVWRYQRRSDMRRIYHGL